MSWPAGAKYYGRGGRQAGFSLVAAIFLIVVLAALGTFAVQVAMTQYQGATLALQEARAQAAAQAGIEYSANLALGGASTCNYTKPLSLQGALARLVVMVSCAANTLPVGTVYRLTATATTGSYGAPDYVARTVRRNVTNVP